MHQLELLADIRMITFDRVGDSHIVSTGGTTLSSIDQIDSVLSSFISCNVIFRKSLVPVSVWGCKLRLCASADLFSAFSVFSSIVH